jgi:hypothetical protein
MYNLFYVNGVKVIPENIYDLLTPAALAHWIQGDGVARCHGLIICTDSYKVENVGGHSKLIVSSVKDIQMVVEFFSFSGLHPLMGHKLTQYNKWINDLRQSSRYCNLKLPEIKSKL